jgi:DNA-binding MarR family transcriptional regulator
MKKLATGYYADEYLDDLRLQEHPSLYSDRELEVLFLRTSHIYEGAIKRELLRIGISPKIAAMLSEICWLDNPTPMELSRISERKPQTITAIINRMVEKGLVIRVVNVNRKNTWRIYLTPKGKLIHQKILGIDVFQRILHELPEEKRIQLQDCLKDLKSRAKRL